MIYALVTVDHEDHLKKISKVNAFNNVIEPTNRIMNFFEKFNIPITFFCNAPEYLAYYDNDHQDFHLYEQQLTNMITRGHDVQMHFHPEWLDYKWIDNKWHSQSRAEYGAKTIHLSKYVNKLEKCISFLRSIASNVIAYRGGGYQIQPLSENLPILSKLGMKLDSSMHSIERPIPFVLEYGIIEVPIYVHQGCRWDMSRKKDNISIIREMMSQYADQNDDVFIVMMGHCKQEVRYDELQYILNTLDRKQIQFITFREIVDV